VVRKHPHPTVAKRIEKRIRQNRFTKLALHLGMHENIHCAREP
jgi:hypothetical protein